MKKIVKENLTFRDVLKFLLLVVYGYFTYLLLLITIQYIPLRFDVAFLRIKYEEIQLLHYKIAFFTHVYSSIFLMLMGWVQFSKKMRQKYNRLHKGLGKLYVFVILFVSGPSGLVMSYHANGGIVAQVAFVLLSILWLVFTCLSYYYIRKQNFKKHREFAIRSFALTLSAVSLRLFKFIIVFLLQTPPMDTYRIVSWLGWTFNLIIAEVILFYLLKNKNINGIKTE
ncbi:MULTISPECIES: DUF2306 domain-containing protein [Flavobacterium]|uniref:DUF2306 domain-containing protein n=1 Tax=Flavobacterium jumunjinense TaxID=998845 RepID=A0ABV5GN63_9FLAO|nr:MULTISPECIES: DUF2306 domain-containing protein [Flavobacterium]